MFYLFILESIGTSELLMIGLIALILFGPRKLPQMVRTIGKTMAEFRRTTDDFKSTWKKEVDFEIDKFKTIESSDLLGTQPKTENSIGKTSILGNNKIAAPEIKEVSGDDFSPNLPEIETPIVEEVRIETDSADKRNWL